MKRVICLLLVLLMCCCSGCATTIITTIEEYENLFGNSKGNQNQKESDNILDSVEIIKNSPLPVATVRQRSSTASFDALDKKQQEIYKTISAAAQNVINSNIPLDNSPTKQDVYIAFWAVVRDHP